MAARYQSGFGNSFETEALRGALPVGRNSPQKVNYGLYAEQLSGSPFTAPQGSNQRSWLYRIRPSVRHAGRFERIDIGAIRTAPAREDTELPIAQLRWSPTPIPKRALNFVTGPRDSPPRPALPPRRGPRPTPSRQPTRPTPPPPPRPPHPPRPPRRPPAPPTPPTPPNPTYISAPPSPTSSQCSPL